MKKMLLFAALLPMLVLAQKNESRKSKTAAATKGNQDNFVINGTVSGYSDGTVVDLLNGNGQPEATTTVKSGKFMLSGKMPYPDYRLICFDKKQEYITFFLENSIVSITVDRAKLNEAIIKGSASNVEFQQYNQIIKPYEAFLNQNESMDSLQLKTGAAAIEKFIKQHPNSYVSPIAVYRHFQLLGDGDKMESLFNSLSADVRITPVGDYILQQIGEARKNPVGKVLPDFSQNDVNGVPFKLSSLRGKYVLVDFWASWCGPCRAENPNVVAAFEKYKNKNFTVLGVSLDKEKAPWLAAIDKDKLNWTQVSDLRGWQNAVAMMFGIQSIPQNFLLDPNGVVVGKNLRGAALEAKLELLLGK